MSKPHHSTTNSGPSTSENQTSSSQENKLPGGDLTSPQLVIQASAGTGKTFQLSSRYLWKLHVGADPDRILATTFTRKAAGEILDRILERLAQAATSPDAAARLQSELNVQQLDEHRCNDLLRLLTRGLHRLRVGTLDSFFIQLAGSQSLELGLVPGWRMAEDSESTALRARAIERMLELSNHDRAVQLMHLLAKGDSTRSVSDLVHNTVKNFYSTYLVTEADAWTRFPQRAMPTEEARNISRATLSNMLEQLKPAMQKAVRKLLEQIEQQDWPEIVKSTLVQNAVHGDRKYSRSPIPDPVCEALAVLEDEAMACQLELLKQRTAATRELLSEFDAVHRQLQEEARLLAFSDVTLQLARYSDAHPQFSSPTAEYRLDAAVEHLFLDEFQDTSLEQWSVLRPFVHSIASQASRRSFFCVGDSKQAIYGWRGGVAAIFDVLPDELPQLAAMPLNTSYRSSPIIIETVNRLFQTLGTVAQDETIRRWCRDFPPHSAHHRDMPGYAALLTCGTPEVNSSMDAESDSGTDSESTPGKKGRAGQEASKSDYQQEALRTALKIVQQVRRESPQVTIGILTRRNEVVGQMMSLLSEHGIEASEEGGVRITTSPYVQLLLSLLTIADHPGDSAAFRHVLCSPLNERLGASENTEEQRRSVSARLRSELSRDGYGQFIENWSAPLWPSASRRDRTRLQQLVTLAERFQSQSTLRPSDFVRAMEAQKVEDPSASQTRVMNVHQSKGLQFDVVILPELDVAVPGRLPEFVISRPQPAAAPDTVMLYCGKEVQRLLPDRLRRAFDSTLSDQIEEQLCGLYVAVTRAVHAMYLIVPPTVKTGKQTSLAGCVLSGLAPETQPQPDQLLFELGDSDWLAQQVKTEAAKAVELDTTAKAAQAAAVGEHLLTPIHFQPAASGTSTAEWLTPSSLEGGGTDRIRSIARPHRLAALAQGDVIHKWFEQIRWISEPLPDDERLRRLAARIDTSPRVIDVALPHFHQLSQQPRVRALLSPQEYSADGGLASDHPEYLSHVTPTATLAIDAERPVAVRSAGRHLFGTIDRLVTVQVEGRPVWADIVDYKTDRLEDSESHLKQRVEFYRPQLESYRQAVSQTLRLPVSQISARLVFLQADRVEPVS